MDKIKRYTQRKLRRHKKKNLSFLEVMRLYAGLPVA